MIGRSERQPLEYVTALPYISLTAGVSNSNSYLAHDGAAPASRGTRPPISETARPYVHARDKESVLLS
jgi:hypothetical protein